jgi:hypothetical protein
MGDRDARHDILPRFGVAIVATVAFAGAAWAGTTDLVVHCDPPMVKPLSDIAEAFRSQTGVELRIFATAPNAIPEQLAREIQNDIVMSQPHILARIGAAGLLADFPPSARWRNRLVIAKRRGEPRRPVDQETLAAPDPVWGGGPDGPAVLAEAGLRPARVLGTFDTGEARALLLSGDASYALLHASELTADLEELGTSGLSAQRLAVAAMTRSARRPKPQALLRFLASEQAAAIFRANFLEPVS